jgi:hypothetical protein
MMSEHNMTDLSDFDGDDKRKIDNGAWVPCRICETIFHRLTFTDRYCSDCKRGFCEGNHGTFAPGRGKCVQCDGRKSN